MPTSRAVPQAVGCPVSEKGPQPGWAILPDSRWTLYMQWFIHVPRLCWFTPMVHSDMTFLFGSANTSASALRSSTAAGELRGVLEGVGFQARGVLSKVIGLTASTFEPISLSS